MDTTTEQIIEMYEAGRKVTEIMAETGRSRTAIYYQLNRHNVQLRAKVATPPAEIAELVSGLNDENNELRRRVGDLLGRIERAERTIDLLTSQLESKN